MKMAPAPTRDEQLATLRAGVAGCERAADLIILIDKLRDLASRALSDELLYDRIVAAIVAAERKGGKLLDIDSAGIGPQKRKRWQQVAQLSECDFGREIEAYKAAAKARREAMLGGGTAAERMHVSRWFRGADGTLTRFVFGHCQRGCDPDRAQARARAWQAAPSIGLT